MKGLAFTRLAIARSVAKGDPDEAVAYASARWGEGTQSARLVKAAIEAGSTDSGNWGNPLVGEVGSIAAEFVAAVRAQSIIGRLQGLRRVPPRTPILAQTGKATGHWVEEGQPAPISAMSFARTSLATLKIAAACVVSDELLQSTDPAAEIFIRNELVAAVTRTSDETFIDPSNAGSTDQRPPAVTNGVTPAVSSGIDAFELDVKRLIASFAGDLETAYFVASPKLLAQIAGVEFPNVGARGGEILGIPAISSANVPDSGGNYQLALIDPAGIAFTSRDEIAEVRSSTSALIDMRDDPTLPPGVGHKLVSAFQVDSTVIAAMLHENWETVRPGSVALLTGIAPVEVMP
ncbi:phage major capsid protein [Sphingobium estronivorans]|uniref:phage major capsid protein n=1 Tax=Sphingobium estronivorans TaxID=1577690 RepID=UPI00123B275E|nr:phage major capsid protein [Sphingobium estronivorans]